MTDSRLTRTAAIGKRRQLQAAAARVLHEQGVARTTIADIANAADVPVGNVYYYYKTKDDLVRAALISHSEYLAELTAELDRLPDPRDRLKALVNGWIDQRDIAARYGCPTGTLAVELGKRSAGTLDTEVGPVIKQLLDWVERQIRALGVAEPGDIAVTIVAAYQGMSLLASALRDPEIMRRQGDRLIRCIDALPTQVDDPLNALM